MVRPLSLLVLFSFSAICRSQVLNGDSLKIVLDKEKKEDSFRVHRLTQYAYSLFYTHPEKMAQYTEEALRIAEKIQWNRGLISAYEAKGITEQFVSNNFTKAFDLYTKGLEIARRTGATDGEMHLLGNIATIFYNQKQYERALHYYRLLLALLEKRPNTQYAETMYMNAANNFNYLPKIDTAKLYYHKGLDLARKKRNVMVIANTLSGLATMALEEGKPAEAEKYEWEALAYDDMFQDIQVKAHIFINLSAAKSGLNQPDSARYYGRQALELATAAKSLYLQKETYKILALNYKKDEDYKNAYEAMEKFSELNDSLLSDESKQAVIRTEMQYEFNKVQDSVKAAHDKQQALTAAEIKQQKIVQNFILGGSGIVILSGGLLFFSYKRRRDANTKRVDAELKAQIADTEMKVMRLQMNPHFIFNSLNSISDYIVKNNPQEADAYLSKFAKVMRMTLEHSERQTISLEDDLQTLELYMQLEAKRLNNKFTYQIKVAPDIDRENTLVPPLIFQPFVENSIWHGIAKKEGPGHIIIDIKKENEMLYCLIDDDGAGRPEKITGEEWAKEKTSLGMKITKARIDILNRLKGSNATVQLTDKPQGLSAELTLPLETAF